MFGFRKRIELSPKLILSPQSRQQDLSPEIDPFDNALPCYPHDNIAGNHTRGECVISTLPHVNRVLVSML